MFIIIVFWIGQFGPLELRFSFVLALLLSILTPLFLASSSFLSHFSFLLFPCERVCENTRAWVAFYYSHTEWHLIFSRNDMTKMAEESPVKFLL